MKTIVRIGQAIDGKEQIGEAKLSSFALAMLAEGFDKRRAESPEAILVVQPAARGPVYITIGPYPPELVPGDRRVFAVFSPIDSQEPVASFHDPERAEAWADATCAKDGYVTRQIDSTDRVGVRACVSVVIKNERDQVLYARLTKAQQWTIPEGDLLVGESVEGAARRCARAHFGIELGAMGHAPRAPYVNVVFPEIGHYLSIVLVAKALGEPDKKTDLYDAWTWGSPTSPPTPQFVTVAAIRRLVTEPTSPALELPVAPPAPALE